MRAVAVALLALAAYAAAVDISATSLEGRAFQCPGLAQKLGSNAVVPAALLAKCGCPAGAQCCFNTVKRLRKCPHVGGVCCPASDTCCPANHECVVNESGNACRPVPEPVELKQKVSQDVPATPTAPQLPPNPKRAAKRAAAITARLVRKAARHATKEAKMEKRVSKRILKAAAKSSGKSVKHFQNKIAAKMARRVARKTGLPRHMAKKVIKKAMMIARKKGIPLKVALKRQVTKAEQGKPIRLKPKRFAHNAKQAVRAARRKTKAILRKARRNGLPVRTALKSVIRSAAHKAAKATGKEFRAMKLRIKAAVRRAKLRGVRTLKGLSVVVANAVKKAEGLQGKGAARVAAGCATRPRTRGCKRRIRRAVRDARQRTKAAIARKLAAKGQRVPKSLRGGASAKAGHALAVAANRNSPAGRTVQLAAQQAASRAAARGKNVKRAVRRAIKRVARAQRAAGRPSLARGLIRVAHKIAVHVNRRVKRAQAAKTSIRRAVNRGIARAAGQKRLSGAPAQRMVGALLAKVPGMAAPVVDVVPQQVAATALGSPASFQPATVPLELPAAKAAGLECNQAQAAAGCTSSTGKLMLPTKLVSEHTGEWRAPRLRN